MTAQPTAASGVADDLLVATGCTKRFGGLVAVSDIDFTIPRGSIVSLIGPNGAGKTTFFNMITGLYVPTEGTISFDGKDITGRKPHEVVRVGIARTFQNIRLFGNMSAEANVLVGLHHRLKGRWFGAILRPPSIIREEEEAHARALELLDLVGLKGRAKTLARNLPYGDQRRLEIARALATEPKLLLLDEPTAGMNPEETSRLTVVRPRAADEARPDRAAHRARHEGGDGHQRPGDGARPRREDRRGLPRRGPRQNTRVIEAYLGRGAAEAG